MPSISVSLSTANVPGPSNPVAINYRLGRPVMWQVTTNSSVAISDFTVQYTLDDIQVLGTYSSTDAYPPTGSPTYAPAVPVWGGLSSTPYLTINATNAAVHFTSSTIFPDGISGAFLAPPAAMRIYSSASSSNILTLKVVYGD